jgi:hypothetical protein
VIPPALFSAIGGSVMAVMFRMRLAGFGGMVMGMMAVARGRVGVMRRGLAFFFFIVLGGFAVMMRGFFVMVGGVVMMLAGGMLVRHGVTPCFLATPG